MPTELTTRFTQTADFADRASPLRGLKSRQLPTVRHDNFGFGDFLNLVNPLNYIPVVSNLYHQANGTQASPVSSIIGGALFGGPLGMAMAGINAVFEAATGKGVIGSIANAVTGDEGKNAEHYTARYSKIANAHKPDYRLSLDA